MLATFKKIVPENILQLLRNIKYGRYSYFYWIFPIKINKIAIINHSGRGYAENGKAITEELICRSKDFDIVWVIDEGVDKDQFPKQVRTVKYGSFTHLFELATSKIWIDNCRKIYVPPKRKNQYYIQTWHASMGIKKIENDVGSSLPQHYIYSAQRDSKNCDLMVAGSQFRYELIKKSFWYQGEILKIGTPRTDVLFTSNTRIKEKIISRLGIPENTNVILFAPTFRKQNNEKLWNLEYKRILKVLEEKNETKWIFLLKPHPDFQELHVFLELQVSSEDIYIVPNDIDMQELLMSVDFLVTDYSSSMFDMAQLRKPCILYTPDLDAYTNSDRNLYFSLDELPFPYAKNQEELIALFKNFDKPSYIYNIESFFEHIGNFETGEATKKLCDVICSIIGDEN